MSDAPFHYLGGPKAGQPIAMDPVLGEWCHEPGDVFESGQFVPGVLREVWVPCWYVVDADRNAVWTNVKPEGLPPIADRRVSRYRDQLDPHHDGASA